MGLDFAERCKSLLEELGLAGPGEEIDVTPLTGGVASDIARIDVQGRRYCVKFALEQLKVEEVWKAPVERNAAEYAWLEFASHVVPQSVPELYGWSQSTNGFAMEFIAGSDVHLWKESLLTQNPQTKDAVAVANVLGKIHAASTKEGFDARPFQNMEDFQAIRIEPYLLFTAQRHDSLSGRIHSIADWLRSVDAVLVHGDVSPKNILFRGDVPIVLDAECATMGDASFDVAFCLNHLVLKAIHRPEELTGFLQSAEAFRATYLALVTWENTPQLESRISALLPVLMLARVDGKSPVEYLSEEKQDAVRRIAIPMIEEAPETLSQVFERIRTGIAS